MEDKNPLEMIKEAIALMAFRFMPKEQIETRVENELTIQNIPPTRAKVRELIEDANAHKKELREKLVARGLIHESPDL